ncbi:MAG: RNA polymerase sigma factor, partial [Phycisphaerae bacterium]
MGKVQSRDLEIIISGCKKKDAASFSRLVDAYSTRLYGYFYRLCGDKNVSDDLLAELFVKLLEKIDYFRGGNFDGWLFTVASNIWHDRLRALQRDDKALQGLREELELSAKQNRMSGQEMRMIDRLGKQLGTLDEESRELIMLRFYSEMSFKEIAESRKMPIGTVLSKVH